MKPDQHREALTVLARALVYAQKNHCNYWDALRAVTKGAEHNIEYWRNIHLTVQAATGFETYHWTHKPDDAIKMMQQAIEFYSKPAKGLFDDE